MEREWIDGRPRHAVYRNEGTQQGILSGPEIRRIVERSAGIDVAAGALPTLPHIKITPFDPRPTTEGGPVGPNSYDVRLGPTLRLYGSGWMIIGDRVVNFFGGETFVEPILDCRDDNPTTEVSIPESGLILEPGRLYLGSTVERTQCLGVVPSIETRSSLARLGVSVHLSAGFGDDGFNNTWTLEITAVHPVRIYAGMRVAQVAFCTLVGDRQPYAGKYRGDNSDGPVASRSHEDLEHHKGEIK